MVASTLVAGDVALVGYNTGQTDGNGTTLDAIQFVLNKAMGSGTVIYISDRAWNGTAFTTAANDGTITITLGADLAAGTVIDVIINGANATTTINGVTSSSFSSGSFNPEEAGDAIYFYQGTGVDAGFRFLFAAEIADGNTSFAGSLANTGLTVGTNAVGIALDSATYSGPTTEAFAHVYNGKSLLGNIADATNWVGDDLDGQKALDQPNLSGPLGLSGDFSLWAGLRGGGGGIVGVQGDASLSGGNAGYNLVQYFTGLLNAGNTVFWGIQDITFDTVHNKFFIVDSDGTGGHNRILQGNISDLLGNPAAEPSLIVLYSDTTTTLQSIITNIEVDANNGIVYFSHGQTFAKVNYNTAGQAQVVLANFGTGSGNPAGSTNNFIDDFVIGNNGAVYLSSHRVTAAADGDQLSRNYVYKITGLSSGSGAGAFTFANSGITFLPFNPDDDDANNGVTFASGEGFPQEVGSLEGLALSADGNTLYIAAAKTLYDNDGNVGTAPILTPGGIYAYALTGNPSGNFTNVYVPTDDGDTNSQTIQVNFGPQGLLDDLEIDRVTGDLFFLDQTGDQLGASNPPGDEGIWRVDTDGTPDPSFFAGISNINGLGAVSLYINRAPTVTSSTVAVTTVTEGSSAPGSGATNLVQPFTAAVVTDPDTAALTDQLAGAVVRIATNFQSGATHQDTLTINGNTSGTLGSGISYAYNAATGVMILSGANTFANYAAAIVAVRFNTSGDDITAFGTAPNRTISWSVSDGLNHSDEITATVTVTGINDAPVNTLGVQGAGTEDALVTALTGLSVADVDSNPTASTQKVQVTLAINVGTLTVLTNVAGGIVAGDVSGNGSASVTITATQNAINATLAAVNAAPALNGLTLTSAANFNGGATLTITTSDQGFNGNDPGLTGNGTSEVDIDTRVISITAVNDAPVATSTTNIAATTILEDQPTTGLTETVSTLFGGQFSDPLDVQFNAGTNPTGSVADTFAGIAVTVNNSGANGQWQYYNGTIWVNIGAASVSAAKTFTAATPIRFNPATDFNGTAPTLTAVLVDSSGGVLTNFATVNVTTTGGTTRFSTDTLTLTQAVTAVNDAPAFAGPGGNASFTENGSQVTVAPTVTLTDVDNTNFNGGSLTVAITGGAVAGDGLFLPTSGNVTFGAGAPFNVTVAGTVIGTWTASAGSVTITFNTILATPAAVISLSQAIGYITQSENPTNAARTVTFTIVDGGGTANNGADTTSFTRTVNVTAVDDFPVAVADNVATNENVVLAGTVAGNTTLIFNDTDVDGGPRSVASVNGVGGNVGAQITLTSGAKLTVQSDGSYSYDPNGAFNYLVAAGAGTGGQTSATDTFTYALNGGSSTTVTVTINGVAGTGDQIRGSAGSDTLTGTAGADYFDISQGGTDTINANDGDDLIFAGAGFDATDTINGGIGNDQVGLRGSYTGSLGNITNTESLVVLSGMSTRYGGDGTPRYTYNLTTTEGTVAPGVAYVVQANELVAGENLRFDGSAETDGGSFRIYAGRGVDTFIGGSGDDGFFFGEGGRFTAADQVNGGAGTADQLGLRGIYNVTFGATTMVNVETVVLLSAFDAGAAAEAAAYTYNLTLNDANVAAGQQLRVNAAQLRSTESATVSGSGETNGSFFFIGGDGNDSFAGGTGADIFYGGRGQDSLTGGGGSDTFRYGALTDSVSGTGVDVINDFTAGDIIDLALIDAITGGSDNAFTFIGNAAFSNVAGQLRAVNAGGSAWVITGDVDGNGTVDFQINVTVTGGHQIVAADFVL